jgi:ribosomal protein L7/L12
MELKEAFDIIDATLGMFRSFAAEIDNSDPKGSFLAIPVRSMFQTVVDEKLNPEMECNEYYNYVDGDREYKMYIVNIRPVCNYIVNEWPSSKAKKIRKLLYTVFRECLDICEEPLKGIIDVAIDEGYSYHMRYNASSQNSRTIESVMLDTIHEMYHALGLTEYAEPDADDQSNNNGEITEDFAKSIDWIKLTNNFDLDRIKDIVKTIGRNERDKKIIVKAIYDAESATGNMYKIPYSVDKLLNELYKKYDENHKGLYDVAYDASTETLNIDVLMKQAIDEYMERHIATNEDIDEIFKDDQSNMWNQKEEDELLLQQIAELKSEVNQLTREKAALEKNNREHQEIANLYKSNIEIADDRKIDVIKILHAMCKVGLFKTKDGSKFTIKTVMEIFGEILNDNFSEYSSNLSTSKSTAKENTFLDIFDKLRNEAERYLNKS